MKKRSTLIGALALAASMSVAPVAGAAIAHTTMAPVTETGKLVKILSSDSFTMAVGKVSYVVKVDGMTHITLDHMAVKLSHLHAGDTITAKGPLDMHTISATTVTAGM